MGLARDEGEQEALKKRASNLIELNGIKLVVVTLPSPSSQDMAHLEVHFYNSKNLQNILQDIKSKLKTPEDCFQILGGHRLRGGNGPGQVKVTKVDETPIENALKLTVKPVGDYSTYIMKVEYYNKNPPFGPLFDPLFDSIRFKFRPGCFTANCKPGWKPGIPYVEAPIADYLAKDFDSFRHSLIAAMMDRVPGWQPSSEADLDQVLIELFSACGDELSDFQDRTMNEAYLATARKRVSLARHARLIDYHISEGNQASTWLALKLIPHSIGTSFVLNYERDLHKRLRIWSGNSFDPSQQICFISDDEKFNGQTPEEKKKCFHYLLDSMELYTWSDSVNVLKAGSTHADLSIGNGDKNSTETVRDIIVKGEVTHLLIQEELNPETGKRAGFDPAKRQILRLILGEGEKGAKAQQDPVTKSWYLRVFWEEQDRLKSNYCCAVTTPQGTEHGVTHFYGNLMPIKYGLPVKACYKEPGQQLLKENEYHYERTKLGVICQLQEGHLLYENRLNRDTVYHPKSTLRVEVDLNAGPGGRREWYEEISLVHSDENDEAFVVETDEEGWASIRFGNGINGKKLPRGAVVECNFQIGDEPAGNVGADRLTTFGNESVLSSHLESCWNPFDVTNGHKPESREEVVRKATEIYRLKQQRAVTLQDYVNIVEKIEGISRASAKYMWTGSWRTVRITVDPSEKYSLEADLKEAISKRLQPFKMIGEDYEIRSAQYVPLEINVVLCINKNLWAKDIQYVLEQEFCSKYTPDGRKGFFHPDNWTFGQKLKTSQIAGRLYAIDGIDHAITIELKRQDTPTVGSFDEIDVKSTEIIQVENDPNHLEKGFIKFTIKGGKSQSGK